MLAIEVARTANKWCIYERTPMAFLPLAGYRRKRDAVTVAKFYADLMSRNLKTDVNLTIETRWGDVDENVNVRYYG